MSDILLSIIIPVYNTELFLANCLKSIIPQLRKNIELIVLNDGSTDNSLEEAHNITSQYEASYNIKIMSHLNKGLSATRNIGIDLAKGDYIFFVDSDDSLYEGSISKIIESIKEYGSDVVTFGFDIIEKNKIINKTLSFDGIGTKNDIKYIIESIPNVFGNAWRYVCKKDFIIKNSLYFEEEILCEDIGWSVRLFLSIQSITLINKQIYKYNRYRPDSIMKTVSVKRICDACSSIHNCYEAAGSLVDNELFNTIMNKLADQLYYTMAHIPLLGKNDIKKAMKCARSSFYSIANSVRPKDRIIKLLVKIIGFNMACRVLTLLFMAKNWVE